MHMYTRLFVLPSVALKVMSTCGSSGWVPERSGSLYCWHSALMCTTPLLANTCRPHSMHTEHIIIYRCKWGKNLQQESQNYHSTMHYACPLSELFVYGDLAKMNTRDGVRRICQMLYPKNLCNSKLTWSEHLECRWWDSVQRSSPLNTGRAEKATQLCLEKWDLHVRLYTLTKLAHSIPHRLENVEKINK